MFKLMIWVGGLLSVSYIAYKITVNPPIVEKMKGYLIEDMPLIIGVMFLTFMIAKYLKRGF